MLDFAQHQYHLKRTEAEVRAADRATHGLAREAHLILAERHADRAWLLQTRRQDQAPPPFAAEVWGAGSSGECTGGRVAGPGRS